jgi:hypothetical protein
MRTAPVEDDAAAEHSMYTRATRVHTVTWYRVAITRYRFRRSLSHCTSYSLREGICDTGIVSAPWPRTYNVRRVDTRPQLDGLQLIDISVRTRVKLR